jgi:hypothetical protein
MTEDKVRVEVLANAGQVQDAIAALGNYGAVIETFWGDLIQVLAPVERLVDISNEGSVAFIRRPLEFKDQAVSEALGTIGAGPWQSSGFTGPLIGTELPSITGIVYENFSATPGSNNHGTAIAEIVHDVSPGATLYLAEADLVTEMGNAVDWLVSQGVHVINVSGGNELWGPGDGTGAVNSMVNKAVASGISWVNAAGNSGARHWAGQWADPDDDSLQNFVGDFEFNTLHLQGIEYVLAGETIEAVLKWNDRWGGACDDYDLLLLRDDPSLGFQEVASSTPLHAIWNCSSRARSSLSSMSLPVVSCPPRIIRTLSPSARSPCPRPTKSPATARKALPRTAGPSPTS